MLDTAVWDGLEVFSAMSESEMKHAFDTTFTPEVFKLGMSGV